MNGCYIEEKPVVDRSFLEKSISNIEDSFVDAVVAGVFRGCCLSESDLWWLEHISLNLSLLP